jgi:hypothetical protein
MAKKLKKQKYVVTVEEVTYRDVTVMAPSAKAAAEMVEAEHCSESNEGHVTCVTNQKTGEEVWPDLDDFEEEGEDEDEE